MDHLNLLKGRPARLTVLDLGFFRVHAGPRDIGIMGFLIETDAGERLLVDGGFPERYADDPAGATAEDGLDGFGEVLSLTRANRLEAQLALAGTTPEAVGLLLLTHSHVDHVGALYDFPQAPLLIAEAERALPRPLFRSGPRPPAWPERETVRLARDALIGPGLVVLQTPGHAPGQLSLLLELPRTGPVILTSDAISRPAEIEERFDTAHDPEAAMASARRLMDLAAERGAFVIYGHGPEQWPSLRKAPLFYD